MIPMGAHLINYLRLWNRHLLCYLLTVIDLVTWFTFYCKPISSLRVAIVIDKSLTVLIGESFWKCCDCTIFKLLKGQLWVTFCFWKLCL